MQDTWHGMHCCTIHPIVMHYCDENGNIQVKSFAYFSDDLDHDIGFVYQLQEVLCEYLRQHFVSLIQIQYSSDGCASQYKNFKKIFTFDISSSQLWNLRNLEFFSTSHGKSPCNGLGGATKRKLAIES